MDGRPSKTHRLNSQVTFPKIRGCVKVKTDPVTLFIGFQSRGEKTRPFRGSRSADHPSDPSWFPLSRLPSQTGTLPRTTCRGKPSSPRLYLSNRSGFSPLSQEGEHCVKTRETGGKRNVFPPSFLRIRPYRNGTVDSVITTLLPLYVVRNEYVLNSYDYCAL